MIVIRSYMIPNMTKCLLEPRSSCCLLNSHFLIHLFLHHLLWPLIQNICDISCEYCPISQSNVHNDLTISLTILSKCQLVSAKLGLATLSTKQFLFGASIDIV